LWRTYPTQPTQKFDAIAKELKAVLNANDVLYSDEAVYFAANRKPPRGLENWFARRVSLAHAKGWSEDQLNRVLEEGTFHAVALSCRDPRMQDLSVRGLYYEHKKIGDYLIWRRR
jgi:hypothetical protein